MLFQPCSYQHCCLSFHHRYQVFLEVKIKVKFHHVYTGTLVIGIVINNFVKYQTCTICLDDNERLEIAMLILKYVWGFVVYSWPRGYKTVFVLNLSEHKISTAHETKTLKKIGISCFSALI